MLLKVLNLFTRQAREPFRHKMKTIQLGFEPKFNYFSFVSNIILNINNMINFQLKTLLKYNVGLEPTYSNLSYLCYTQLANYYRFCK